MTEYILFSAVVLAFLILWLKIAQHFHLLDSVVNGRSSHRKPVVRAGGVVYILAASFVFLLHPSLYLYFYIGFMLVALVSFCDDVSFVSIQTRLMVQFVAVAVIFYSFDLYPVLPFWAAIMGLVLAVGAINAYNFMDGINGMTALHTIVVLLALLFARYFFAILPSEDVLFDIYIYPVITSLIFLFFNFRKNAKCFPGDVGSIGIAFWVVYLIIGLMVETGSAVWILFLAVYGIDTVFTIAHRIYLGQNIFMPHRLHLFQILCNEYSLDHRIVSAVYAFTQAVISLAVILLYRSVADLYIFIFVLLPLSFFYLVKFSLMHKKHIEPEKIRHQHRLEKVEAR